MKISKAVALLVPVILIAGCASNPRYSGAAVDETLIETGGVTSGTTTPSLYRPQSPFGTAAPIAVQPAADPDF